MVRTFSITFLIVLTASAFSHAQVSAQNIDQSGLWVESLAEPVYPSLARSARIIGDVELRVKVRRDGSVISAEIVSGPAMLQESARASALKSRFRCWPECIDETTTGVVTYTFGTREGSCCCNSVRLHSWKCLYLWKCGSQKVVPGQPPAVGSAQNRIIILADPMCVETDRSITTPR